MINHSNGKEYESFERLIQLMKTDIDNKGWAVIIIFGNVSDEFLTKRFFHENIKRISEQSDIESCPDMILLVKK